jgi:hypothetical protein
MGLEMPRAYPHLRVARTLVLTRAPSRRPQIADLEPSELTVHAIQRPIKFTSRGKLRVAT